jgi:hypothetical protein
MLITVFTQAYHLSLPWARLIHSTSFRLMPLWSIIIISSHIRLDLPSGFFPSGFYVEILYDCLFSTIHATFPTRFILLDLTTWILFGENWKVRSSSFCSFRLLPPFLGSLVVLSTLFTNTLSLYIFLSVIRNRTKPWVKTIFVTQLRLGSLQII